MVAIASGCPRPPWRCLRTRIAPIGRPVAL